MQAYYSRVKCLYLVSMHSLNEESVRFTMEMAECWHIYTIFSIFIDQLNSLRSNGTHKRRPFYLSLFP